MVKGSKLAMAKSNRKNGKNVNGKRRLADQDTKTKGKAAAGPKQANKKRKTDVEYENLGDIDSWDWSEVAVSSNNIFGEEGGFLCLEEIDDVEIEYEGDDTTGKVAKFKRVKNPNRKAGKKAVVDKPLSEEEMAQYYDLDTFNEELAAKQAATEAEAGAEAENEETGANDTEMEENEATVEEDKEIKEGKTTGSSKESEKAAAKSDQPKKEDKQLLKKKQRLEKLREQVKKLEAQLGEDAGSDNEEEPTETPKDNTPANKKQKKRPTLDDVDQSFDVSAWESLKMAEPIMQALKLHQFAKPTPIQEKALPLALTGRDIIGAAETGSGKTLAFGIPIVQYLVEHGESATNELAGLILTPTRELAMQVKDHIENMAVFTSIKIAAIVGGMSSQKQQRLLNHHPNIIVATPGRLWELFSGNEKYMQMLHHIKFLVLDEADRMLEKGHFEELTNLLEILSKKRQDTTEWPEESEEGKIKHIKRDSSAFQTFVFTATLSENLRFNVKRKKPAKKAKGTLEDLLDRLEFADKEPSVVDMTTEQVVASRLAEAKIDCLKNDKDLYVYYFVTRYPGRTIIFVNSIDAIRRLVPVFRLLNVEVLGLHAQMQQKQRLKNLDRFKNNPKAVLVASDVAARGLDIPAVEHVIHYQLPRSGEIYVHRSGRTARANRDGISLLLVGPDEMKIYTRLCHTLRKGDPYPDFPVDLNILNEIRKRVNLATDIDRLEHQENKSTHEENWMRNMAAEMDIDFDEDLMQGKHKQTQQESERNRSKAKAMRGQLKQLLTQPMLPRGVSKSYLTGGVISDIVDRLLNSQSTSLLPGHETSKAVEDIKKVKTQKKTKKQE